MTEKKAAGLEGVVAAETRLSHVQGDVGRLTLAGHDLEKLAGKVGFEDVVGLLWNDALPSDTEREELRAGLARGRALAFERLPRLGDALERDDAMDALRAGFAHLSAALEPDWPTAGVEALGAGAVLVAVWLRRQQGLNAVAPDPALGHAADYLRMQRGAPVSDAEASGMDAYLVTVAEHGMNASTFTARVIGSTGSDLISALTGAIGALKGPLHGGAPGPVLDMLDAVGEANRAEEWIRAELAAGRRIMGMGHRVYRVRDPRAAVLEQAVLRLEREAERAEVSRRLALARAVERAAEQVLAERHPERPLRANVEFYTAVLLEALGIDRRAFSATFAVARIAGWCAHYREQRLTGRLIRPRARYVGR